MAKPNLQMQADSYHPSQQWQVMNECTNGQWKDLPRGKRPGFFFDSEYRIKPAEPAAESITIKLNTVGSHTLEGWWVKAGMPKLPPHVIIDAVEGYASQVEAGVEFLKEQGAQTVTVNPYIVLREWSNALN